MIFTPSSLVGLVYPTFETYKLIESKGDSAAVSGCMTYWVVFGVFTLVEGFVDSFLSWVPLYSLARVAFQVWLFMSNFSGASTVYSLAIVPVLSKVDAVVAQINKEFVRAEKTGSSDKPHSK
jgi:receptor expression-enhancing protein 1/2/3/4